MRIWILAALIWGSVTGGAMAETVAARLMASYDAVQTLSCAVRRDMPLPDGNTMRMLSRVYYQRPDKLHVENHSPVKRRTVSDGTVFRQYAEGAPKGFSRPVAELNEEMLFNLRMVPGSAMNLLAMVQDSPETLLDGTAEFPVRAAYDRGHSYAVVSLDAEGRLARFEMFSSAAMTDLQARTDYSVFVEVLPGVWIACLQQARVWMEGFERTDTTRVDNPVANEEIPAGLFDGAGFFAGVEFVDDYKKIMPGPVSR